MILNSDSHSWVNSQLSSRFRIEWRWLSREREECTVRTDIWKIFSALSLLLLWQDWTFFSIFLIFISGWQCKLKVVFVELVVVFTQWDKLYNFIIGYFLRKSICGFEANLSLLIIKHKIQEYRTIWGQYQVINFKYFNHFFFKTRRIFLFLEYPNKYDFPKRSPMFSYPLLSCFVQYRIRTFLSKQDI